MMAVGPDGVVIDTARLIIRQLQQGDLDAMALLFGNPNVACWMGDGMTLSREQCDLWIAKSQQNYHTYGYGVFAVVLRETNTLIGCGGLIHPDGENAEIIYAIDEAHWRRGYGREILKPLLQHGFDHSEVADIYATVDPDNSGSICLLTEVGMQYINTAPDADGLPTATYSLTRPARQ